MASTSDIESGTKRHMHSRQERRLGDLVLARLALSAIFYSLEVGRALVCICTISLKGSGRECLVPSLWHKLGRSLKALGDLACLEDLSHWVYTYGTASHSISASLLPVCHEQLLPVLPTKLSCLTLGSASVGQKKQISPPFKLFMSGLLTP